MDIRGIIVVLVVIAALIILVQHLKGRKKDQPPGSGVSGGQPDEPVIRNED